MRPLVTDNISKIKKYPKHESVSRLHFPYKVELVPGVGWTPLELSLVSDPVCGTESNLKEQL